MSTSDHWIDLSVFLNDLWDNYFGAWWMYINSTFYDFYDFLLLIDTDFSFTDVVSLIILSALWICSDWTDFSSDFSGSWWTLLDLADSFTELSSFTDFCYFYLWSESFWECTDSLAYDFFTEETLLLDLWEASGSRLISWLGKWDCLWDKTFCDCLSLLSWISLMD